MLLTVVEAELLFFFQLQRSLAVQVMVERIMTSGGNDYFLPFLPKGRSPRRSKRLSQAAIMLRFLLALLASRRRSVGGGVNHVNGS